MVSKFVGKRKYRGRTGLGGLKMNRFGRGERPSNSTLYNTVSEYHLRDLEPFADRIGEAPRRFAVELESLESPE